MIFLLPRPFIQTKSLQRMTAVRRFRGPARDGASSALLVARKFEFILRIRLTISIW